MMALTEYNRTVAQNPQYAGMRDSVRRKEYV